MRVIATAKGYDGVVVRQPGEEFEMPDGAKGSWFKPKDPPKDAAPTGADADRKARARAAAEA